MIIRRALTGAFNHIVWTVSVPNDSTTRVVLTRYAAEQIQVNQSQSDSNEFDLAAGTHEITIHE